MQERLKSPSVFSGGGVFNHSFINPLHKCTDVTKMSVYFWVVCNQKYNSLPKRLL